MVPIILRTRGSTPPPGPLHYAVTADGVFEVRETDIYRSETKSLVKLPGVERGSEYVEIRLPLLPAALMSQAVAFFATVNRLCGSEGVLILFFDPRTQSFRAEAPVQLVKAHASHSGRYLTSLAVKYGTVVRPAGYLRCGSIHSHADMPAFASGTDCDDELGEDGLHVVVGDFGKSTLSVSAAFTVAGRRFSTERAEVIEAFDEGAASLAAPPVEWLAASTIKFVDGMRTPRYLPLARVSAADAARRGSLYDVTALLPLATTAAPRGSDDDDIAELRA